MIKSAYFRRYTLNTKIYQPIKIEKAARHIKKKKQVFTVTGHLIRSTPNVNKVPWHRNNAEQNFLKFLMEFLHILVVM